MHPDPSDNEIPPAATPQRHHTENAKTSPKTSSLAKPSPKKHAKRGRPRSGIASTKAITRNDVEAKEALILEIEQYWGKDFIKSYIPKVHRPLAKNKGINGKRVGARHYENNPKNWKPTNLQSMLMLAKHTSDKKWLHKAIDDVVRYRLKHTGNRKPQLVKTDFDIIDDMLVRGWTVKHSFEIRYNYLVRDHKEQSATDEDIEHILHVSSGEDEEEDTDDVEEGNSAPERNKQSSQRIGKKIPSIPRNKTNARKHETPIQHPHNSVPPLSHNPFSTDHIYPFGPTIDHWGRATLGYSGYQGYTGETQHPGFNNYTGYPGTNAAPLSRYGMFPPPIPSVRTPMRGVTGGGHRARGEDAEAVHDTGSEERDDSTDSEEGQQELGEGEDLDAELAEAELKVARLKAAQKARMAEKKDTAKQSA